MCNFSWLDVQSLALFLVDQVIDSIEFEDNA